ncbi:hypothetical protein [Dactylosporangium sp. NPDC000521]|uniref:hypothetical protein n=1 Tax=Dactylosporangium sp. NPDC000521 TaxID=3363975 RepID=UPI00367A3F9D
MDVVDPVFVDRSGRRRRLFTILGAGLGVLLVAGCALLIAGLLGASPVPLPGLPENGQMGRHQAGLGTAPTSGTPARPSAKPTSARPAAAPVTGGGASPSPSASASEPHDNRKTAHPGNPRPSRTK